MTSLFVRVCLNRRPVCGQVRAITYGCLRNFEPVRWAGHSKWQNIRSTKQANDLAKGKMISRYVQLVRKAIVSNSMQANPKLNSKLAEVLHEASKYNVPKATLERAMVRAVNLKIYTVNIEIQGPHGCALVARCETDNVGVLRRDLKKCIRKHDATLVPDDTIINMFKSQGFVRTATTTADGRDIDQDFAEEAAIMANAEEVYLESFGNAAERGQSNTWVFATYAETVNMSKGELEKQGFKVLSSDVELVPYRAIDFGADAYEKLEEVIAAVRELDQVIDVFHNMSAPAEDSP